MATPTIFAELQAEVDNLFGAAFLTPDERDRRLNEANIELCTRSGWTRSTLSLGDTVDGQEFYTLPDEFRKFADDVVSVGPLDYGPSDPATIRRAKRNELARVIDGAWWTDYQAGVRVLGLYPVPTTPQPIEVFAVITPDPLEEDDDEPPVPWDFREALVHYTARYGSGASEDDTDLYGFHNAVFEAEVDRLTRLRIEIESGDGPLQLMPKGVMW